MQLSRAMIEIADVTKAYGYAPVLRGVSLTVERGQSVALLGANGSGKSTLLRLIAGLSRADAGAIRVGGWDMPAEAQQVRQHIGLVSHKSLLYPALTARENLVFFARLYSVPHDDTTILALLARVGLRKRASSIVRNFSRGMQQRLSIARALLHNPDVLLLDEPYTGLDQEASVVLDDLLHSAHAEQRTVLLTTHDLQRVPHIAERTVILHKGVIAYDAVASLTGTQLAQEYQRITGEVASI